MQISVRATNILRIWNRVHFRRVFQLCANFSFTLTFQLMLITQ